MDRRGILKFMVATPFGVSLFDEERSLSSCTATLKCRSLLHPNKIYLDVQSFWKDHKNPAASSINNHFVKMGWLKDYVANQSRLLPGGQSVELKMSFKSKTHKNIFCFLYRKKKANLALKESVDYYSVDFS